MVDINKLLRARMEHTKSFAEGSRKYLEIVKDIVRSMNPEEYKHAVDGIATLISLADEISEWTLTGSGKEILQRVADLYEKFIIIDDAITILISVLENPAYAKMALYNMSATYIMNVSREKNHSISEYEAYVEESVATDEKIFELVFEAAGVTTSPEDAFSWIIEHSSVINKFTIKLIGNVIRVISGERRRQLELIIENQKDILLGATRIDMAVWKGAQAMLVRYGLRPITSSETPARLFEQLGAKYDTKISLDENFKTLARNGPGIIYINKSSPSPVEFDLRGLIDVNYITANDLKTNQQSGVTEKIINRFSTAKLLPRVTGPSAIVKYPPKSGNRWYVIESINGELIRLLGRGEDKALGANVICGLIQGVSSRAHNYNSIQTEEILSKCFDPKAKMILQLYEDEKTSLPSADPIKNSIVTELSEWASKSLKNHMPENGEAFKRMAVNQQIISEVLLDVLTHSIGIHGLGSSEYMITYISKFDSIIRAFIKELERKWLEENINDRMFSELSPDNLRGNLLGIFTTVIKASIDELDRNKLWTEYDISIKEYFLERKQAIV